MYDLHFLVYRALHGGMDGYLEIFIRDFMRNDDRVARWFKKLVKSNIAWLKLNAYKQNEGQSNSVPVRLMDMRLRWQSKDQTSGDDETGLGWKMVY